MKWAGWFQKLSTSYILVAYSLASSFSEAMNKKIACKVNIFSHTKCTIKVLKHKLSILCISAILKFLKVFLLVKGCLILEAHEFLNVFVGFIHGRFIHETQCEGLSF